MNIDYKLLKKQLRTVAVLLHNREKEIVLSKQDIDNLEGIWEMAQCMLDEKEEIKR